MLVHRSNLNTVNTYVQEQNKTVTFTLWNCASGSPAPEMYSLSILHMGMGVNFSYLTRLNAIQVIVWSNLLRHSIVTTATCTRNAWPAHVSQKQRLRKRALREPYASCSHTEKQEMNRCTMSINRHLQKQTCTARCCGKRVTDTEPWSLFFFAFPSSMYTVPLLCALHHNLELSLYHTQRNSHQVSINDSLFSQSQPCLILVAKSSLPSFPLQKLMWQCKLVHAVTWRKKCVATLCSLCGTRHNMASLLTLFYILHNQTWLMHATHKNLVLFWLAFGLQLQVTALLQSHSMVNGKAPV